MITGSIAYNRWVAQNTGSTSPGWVATVNGQNITVRQNIASLRVERENVSLANALLIPGLQTPLSELRSLLFGQGQQGGIWMPSLSPTMISGNTFGTGVQTFIDLSGRGNNATQATSGFRPAWGRVPKTGRTNIYEQTENIDNAYWTKTDVTVLNNFVSATTGTDRQVRSPFFSGLGTTPHTHRIRIIPSGGLRWVYSFGGVANASTWFDLQTVTVGTTGINTSNASITFDGTAYTITHTSAGIGTNRIIGLADADNSTTYTHAAGRGLTILSVQMNAGTSILPYQRVTTAFDITEAGQRDCYYLQPDGSDDSMATGSINFTGTDKVTVFAAVRRLSNAARGTYLELTDSIASNNGAFHLTAPNGASSTFGFESKGTTLRDVESTVALSTSARILTAVGDISGDLASLQVDNGTPVTNTGDQGTGNYSNAVLRFYRRGGASQPASLQDFGVIVVQGLVSASVAARVRRIMSRYAPGVSL